MSSQYNFKNITPVPQGKDLKEIVLSATQRKTPTVVHKHYAISRIRAFYVRKIKFAQQTLHDRLSLIINEFPKLDLIHPFYADLMGILYDKDHYKVALGQVNTARNLVDNVSRDYVRLMKYGDSLYRCKMLKRAGLGRMVKILRGQRESLAYLEQVRQHLGRLPSIDPNTRSLLLTGFPNVGKSSLLNTLTRADVEVQPYAFTTKSLYIGHADYKYLRWQIIDTPGILDQPLEERNIIEMQAVTALAHLRAAVVYVVDISEQCNHSLEEQLALFRSIKPLFANKPVIVAVNKIDILSFEDLSAEKKAVVESFKEEGVQLHFMSTKEQSGVMELRSAACDLLLAHRVEAKLRSNKAAGVLNRLRVAEPKPRDDVQRPPIIPAAALARMEAKAKGLPIPKTRKFERELEEELGDDYTLDLKKNFLLANPEEKHDIIPEIWEGHNIADFVGEDMAERVRLLVEEEEARKAGGVYDSDMDSDDEETAQIRATAREIRKKQMIIIKDSRIRKHSNKKAPASTRKRERSGSRLEDRMAELGVDVEAKKMRHLERAQSRGRSQSARRAAAGPTDHSVLAHRTRSRSAPRDEAGLKDAKMVKKVKKVSRGKQKWRNRAAKKGEGDRVILDMKPKHLFSGKRKQGKTDRR